MADNRGAASCEHRTQQVFEELIYNRNSSSSIYGFESLQYDKQVTEDKKKWKERLELIGLMSLTSIVMRMRGMSQRKINLLIKKLKEVSADGKYNKKHIILCW